MIADPAGDKYRELKKQISQHGVPESECWIGPDPNAEPREDGWLTFVLLHVPSSRRLAESSPFPRLVTDSLS